MHAGRRAGLRETDRRRFQQEVPRAVFKVRQLAARRRPAAAQHAQGTVGYLLDCAAFKAEASKAQEGKVVFPQPVQKGCRLHGLGAAAARELCCEILGSLEHGLVVGHDLAHVGQGVRKIVCNRHPARLAQRVQLDIDQRFLWRLTVVATARWQPMRSPGLVALEGQGDIVQVAQAYIGALQRHEHRVGNERHVRVQNAQQGLIVRRAGQPLDLGRLRLEPREGIEGILGQADIGGQGPALEVFLLHPAPELLGESQQQGLFGSNAALDQLGRDGGTVIL